MVIGGLVLLYSMVLIVSAIIRGNHGSSEFKSYIVRAALALGGLLVYVPFSKLKLFVHVFQFTLGFIAAVASVVRTVLITENGILAAVLFPIVVYFVIGLRFRNAWIVCMVDVFVYNMYLLFIAEQSWDQLLTFEIFVIILQARNAQRCAYHYSVQRAARIARTGRMRSIEPSGVSILPAPRRRSRRLARTRRSWRCGKTFSPRASSSRAKSAAR